MNSISLDQLLEVEKDFYQTLQTYWRQHNYLQPKWWFIISLSALSPIAWFFLIDKKRITEITCFGLFYGTAASILDSIGSNALFWIYPVRITPYIYPQFYPYDVGIVIIPFMIAYQRWQQDFKKFFLASGVLAAFLAFIAEPTMEVLGIYKELIWKNYYSFPIYWLLSVVCWKIIQKFKAWEKG